MNNIFSNDENADFGSELFFELFKNGNCVIEKIVSAGQITEESRWLEEENDEWVILLQGKSELLFENGRREIMKEGDYLLIPSKTRHRVIYTSSNPKCIWLAVHIK